MFAAYLSQSVTAGTVRSYLSAIRYFHIKAGLPDPALLPSSRLSYILKGIQRRTSGHARAKRLPLTPQLLVKIHAAWSQGHLTFDRVMLWAAFCLGFFGFMRSGEFTCPSPNEVEDCALSVADVAIDSRINPRMLTIFLRKSKTDQYGVGTHICVGRTGSTLCPVSAMLAYMAIRPPIPGPLFIFQDGSALTRDKLVTHLRQALAHVGVDASNFSGHSFRIGAATTAALAGFSDSFIQTLGRWKSSAFTAYISTSKDEIVAASAVLAKTDVSRFNNSIAT